MAKDEQKVRLRARIKALKYFRLIRGPGGGMADHPDRLAVEFEAWSHEDIEEITAALSASARPLPLDESANGFGHILFTDRVGMATPGEFTAWDVKLETFRKPGSLEMFIVGEDNAYRIMMSAVEAARSLEPRLAKVAHRMVNLPARKDANPAPQAGGLALTMMLAGAALLILAAMVWFRVGELTSSPAVFAPLHELGGSPLVIGAFLVTGLLAILYGWRLRRAERGD